MNFVVVGLSHKSAPVEIREQAFVDESMVGECVRRLIDHDLIESGALLSTCNRTELYAVTDGDAAEDRLLEAFGRWPHKLSFEDWRRHAYRLTGPAALAHLFRVAAGLESMVVGEGQVLGQLKAAHGQAHEAGVIDARLDIVIRGAIRAGKRVRDETSLGRKPVSVSHVAVDKAAELIGDLSGKGVLLVGTGPMSTIALRLLQNRGIGPLHLASRTLERAHDAALPIGAIPIGLEGVNEIAGSIDVIMSSTAAPHYLFDRPRIEAVQARRAHRTLVIVDMAVPRDIDPAVSEIRGVHLLNIDDLQSIAERNREERKAWIADAEAIIDQEMHRTRRVLDARNSAATITALVARAEQLRDRVLERHLENVPDGQPGTREALRALAQALTASFLDGPVRALREAPDDARERAIISEAFGLDRQPS